MTQTNAERQCAYRKRHRRQRLQLFLSAHAKAQLDQLARHKRYTVTALIEEWCASAERRAGRVGDF